MATLANPSPPQELGSFPVKDAHWCVNTPVESHLAVRKKQGLHVEHSPSLGCTSIISHLSHALLPAARRWAYLLQLTYVAIAVLVSAAIVQVSPYRSGFNYVNFLGICSSMYKGSLAGGPAWAQPVGKIGVDHQPAESAG